MMITYCEALEDVKTELSRRGVSDVLIAEKRGKVEDMAREHMKCVNSYECDREWSVENVCDTEADAFRIRKGGR